MSSNNFTHEHLMKLEWLLTNVPDVESPDRAECAILEVILAGQFLGQLRLSILVAWEPLCEPPFDAETPF